MKLLAWSRARNESVRRIDVGCGANKKDGCFGIDARPTPAADLVLDVSRERWPFADGSIEYVYCNHALEHLTDLRHVLKEIIRVCAHDARVEIWTPYGTSSDAYMLGHKTFFVNRHWEHICFAADRGILQDAPGYFLWEAAHYCLTPGILDRLKALSLPFEFAMEHMMNIVFEFGVFLRVKRDAPRAPGPQTPARSYGYGREDRVVG